MRELEFVAILPKNWRIMVTFSITPESKAIIPEITYLLNVWAKNQQIEINFSGSSENAVTIGVDRGNKIQVTNSFVSTGSKLDASGFIPGSDGRPDFLATAFYMLNSMQEFQEQDRDELNRFKYANSYQSRLGNSKENVVQYCFDQIARQIGLTPKSEDSRFFLSHDIDMVHGAIVEDGFNVLKKGRIDIFLRMIFNVAMGRPDWLNMDKIMRIESEYDCKSVFFWLVNRGKINKREKNADYSFSSKAIQRQFQLIKEQGFENGLHKSISNESFLVEIKKLGHRPLSNRYHYLKFQLPDAFHDIEAAGLKLDASLGFAEEIGFRNNYGLPFNPFNFVSRKPFTFLEVPLHVMDRTYFQYKKFDVVRAEKEIIGFFERNRRNSVLSVLWHNNFFTNYKFRGYLDLYKKILSYIKDNNFRTISQVDIIDKYSII